MYNHGNMEIKLDAICREFDIRAEEVFAFMDDENIFLGGSLMHDICISPEDFRKFVEYWRRQLQARVAQAQDDLDHLDEKAEAFLRSLRNLT